MMDKYRNHQNQLNKTTLHLQKCFPSARFFTQIVGEFYLKRVFYGVKSIKTLEHFKNWVYSINKFRIKINKPGMSDQFIIMPVVINGKKIPVFIPIETKTGAGKLLPHQIKWKKIYENLGCKYIEARNEFDVEKEINDYINYLKG